MTQPASKRLVTEAALTTALGFELDTNVFTAYGIRPILYANTTTGAWPARTVPTGYSGPVIWDSVDYERASGSGASDPATAGALDGDRWRSKV